MRTSPIRQRLATGVTLILVATALWPADNAFGQKADAPALRPYQINRDQPTKLPQIVPVVRGKDLFIAWQAWGADGKASTKVFIHKIALAALAEGKLAAVREVASLGTLVGFTVDGTGGDHVLTAKSEYFANSPEGKFVEEVHNNWRKDAFAVAARGKVTDLNSNKFTDLPFYGLTNAGTGRMAATTNALAAVFARRRFTPKDNLVHQEANALVVAPNWTVVGLKAGNTVSHSFDQRLIADGTDFLALHQADVYPYAGLIAEKIVPGAGRVVHCNIFACPTFGNSVFFELGGVAAEKDGYAVLFTATRNTQPVTSDKVNEMGNQAWDLALVYLLRGFEKVPRGPNPYDTVGVLATKYAANQEFTVDNFTWNPATSRYDKKEPRPIKRRVLWLTEYDVKTRAASAQLVRLKEGQFVAMWEEHGGAKPITRAMLLTITGKNLAKTVKKGESVELPDLRLHKGDDAFAITIDKKPYAAWVTAGESDDQLLLHTLDGQLAYKALPLKLP